MANDEHFQLLNKLLEQGVDAWNRWRNENQAIVPLLMEVNLSSRDIRNIDLSNCYLRRANLRDANLNGANLSGADLSDVNLSLAKLNNSNFSNSYLRRANLRMADLKWADLRWADLRWADLKWADLKWADLKWADLRWTDLRWSELWEADFRRAKLWEADFRKAQMWEVKLNNSELYGAKLNSLDLSRVKLKKANLKKAKLKKTNLKKANLNGANLKKANLNGANLSELDLSEANLREANLSEANLSRTQALRTDFTGAKFTGACLEDWNTNSATKLNNIDCQYVYLRQNNQERRPISGEFAPGEFTKLFQKVFSTIDLIFRNGVDWEAFAYSFRRIQIENESFEITIRSIEVIDDGIVLVKVNVPEQADKTKLHSIFLKGYKFAKKELESQYQARLGDKNKEINRLVLLLNQATKKLGEISKYMAEQPKVKQDFHASVYGVAGNVEGDFNNYTPEQRQNLVEAAKEIKALLQHLQQSYPTTTTSEKMSVVAKAVDEIERNPTLKARVIGALKAGGTEALKELVDNPLINILLASIEGWQEAE